MTRNPLIWCASLLCLALIPCAWMVSRELASTLHHCAGAADHLGAAPALLAERVTARQASVDALPGKVLPPVLRVVDAARLDVTTRADAQITALRGDVMGRVDTIERDANARTGEALALVEGHVGGGRPPPATNQRPRTDAPRPACRATNPDSR